MSTLALPVSGSSASSPLARFEDLPDDVTTQILELLEPVDISTYAQLNKATHQSVKNSSIWTSIANRYLLLNPVKHSTPLSPTQVFEWAKSLACHWHVSTGLFVAGVPVHRRSGFNLVQGRGGIEIALTTDPDNKDASYVFGGRFANRAIPSQTPSLDLHFQYDPKGPFPVNGLKCRLLYAVEPPKAKKSWNGKERVPDDDSLGRDISVKPNVNKSLGHDGQHDPSAPSVYDDFDADDGNDYDTEDSTNTVTHATFKVKLNETCILQQTCNPTTAFSDLIFTIPPSLLVTKPAFNVLSIEYLTESSAGFWLRDVSLAPTIVPLTNLPASTYEFPLAVSEQAKKNDRSASRMERSTFSASSSSDNLSVGSSSDMIVNPRDPTSSNDEQLESSQEVVPVARNGLHPLTLNDLNTLVDVSANGMKNNRSPNSGERVGKLQNKVGRRPKHMYHRQNQHFRSPRSPRFNQNTSSGNRNNRR